MSTNTAVETGCVKNGIASQAWRDLHLLDNGLSLLNGSIYVAIKNEELQDLHRKDIATGKQSSMSDAI